MVVAAVVLTVEPSHLLSRCLESIEKQTLVPQQIEIIRNVMPCAEARLQGIALVECDYLVFVDDDMILDSDCFARLYALMAENSRLGDVSLPLEDSLAGKIMGVHMYRRNFLCEILHVEKYGIDILRWLSEQIRSGGYDVLEKYDASPAGLHHPVYKPVEAYWKYVIRAKKCRYYADGYPCFKQALNKLCEQWILSGDAVVMYAMAGFFDGLRTSEASCGLTYEGRADAPGFLRIRSGLRELQGYDPSQEKGTGVAHSELPRLQIKRIESEIGSNDVLMLFSQKLILRHLVRRLIIACFHTAIRPFHIFCARFSRGA